MSAIIISVMARIFSISSRRCGNVCKRSEGRNCGKRCLRAEQGGVGLRIAARVGDAAERRERCRRRHEDHAGEKALYSEAVERERRGAGKVGGGVGRGTPVMIAQSC